MDQILQRTASTERRLQQVRSEVEAVQATKKERLADVWEELETVLSEMEAARREAPKQKRLQQDLSAQVQAEAATESQARAEAEAQASVAQERLQQVLSELEAARREASAAGEATAQALVAAESQARAEAEAQAPAAQERLQQVLPELEAARREASAAGEAQVQAAAAESQARAEARLHDLEATLEVARRETLVARDEVDAQVVVGSKFLKACVLTTALGMIAIAGCQIYWIVKNSPNKSQEESRGWDLNEVIAKLDSHLQQTVGELQELRERSLAEMASQVEESRKALMLLQETYVRTLAEVVAAKPVEVVKAAEIDDHGTLSSSRMQELRAILGAVLTSGKDWLSFLAMTLAVCYWVILQEVKRAHKRELSSAFEQAKAELQLAMEESIEKQRHEAVASVARALPGRDLQHTQELHEIYDINKVAVATAVADARATTEAAALEKAKSAREVEFEQAAVVQASAAADMVRAVRQASANTGAVDDDADDSSSSSPSFGSWLGMTYSFNQQDQTAVFEEGHVDQSSLVSWNVVAPSEGSFEDAPSVATAPARLQVARCFLPSTKFQRPGVGPITASELKPDGGDVVLGPGGREVRVEKVTKRFVKDGRFVSFRLEGSPHFFEATSDHLVKCISLSGEPTVCEMQALVQGSSRVLIGTDARLVDEVKQDLKKTTDVYEVTFEDNATVLAWTPPRRRPREQGCSRSLAPHAAVATRGAPPCMDIPVRNTFLDFVSGGTVLKRSLSEGDLARRLSKGCLLHDRRHCKDCKAPRRG